MSQPVPALALVALLLVAGCGGAPGAGDEATPNGGSPTATPGGAAAAQFDWVAANGSVNETALADRHEAHLRAAASYRLNRSYRLDRPEDGELGGGPVPYRFVRRVDERSQRRHSTRRFFHPGGTELWGNYHANGTLYRVRDTQRGVRYDVTGADWSERHRELRLPAALEHWELRANGTVRRDGARYVRFTSRNYTGNPDRLDSVTDARAAVLVTERGRVVSFRRTVNGTVFVTPTDGAAHSEPATVYRRYHLRGVNATTVEEPGWVATTRERANATMTGTPTG